MGGYRPPAREPRCGSELPALARRWGGREWLRRAGIHSLSTFLFLLLFKAHVASWPSLSAASLGSPGLCWQPPPLRQPYPAYYVRPRNKLFKYTI